MSQPQKSMCKNCGWIGYVNVETCTSICDKCNEPELCFASELKRLEPNTYKVIIKINKMMKNKTLTKDEAAKALYRAVAKEYL